MRHITVYLSLILLFISCEEETVQNDSTSSETSNFGTATKSYKSNTCEITTSLDNPTFARKILAEEISGVKCSQCVPGHEKFESFKDFYGKKLVTINYHGLSLAGPTALSIQDFRNSQADSIYEDIGAPNFYPFATFNRVKPTGEDIPFIISSKWNTQIIAEAAKTTSNYQIDLTSTFDTCSYVLNVDATVHANSHSTPNNISFYIIENDIEDAQLTTSKLEEEYIHQSTFRKAFPSALGLPLPTIEAGKNTTISQTTTLDDYWETKNCHLIVVITDKNNTKEVLQVEQMSIQ